jgi:hypothetical protein
MFNGMIKEATASLQSLAATPKANNPLIYSGLNDDLAEEEGFEPPEPVKVLRFSRPVQ